MHILYLLFRMSFSPLKVVEPRRGSTGSVYGYSY
jgi:hypothetical protein